MRGGEERKIVIGLPLFTSGYGLVFFKGQVLNMNMNGLFCTFKATVVLTTLPFPFVKGELSVIALCYV